MPLFETTTGAKYAFQRDERSRKGFLSTNSISTDAINALERWRAKADQRSYEIVADDEGLLAAQLVWNCGDERVGNDLDAARDEFGVE